MQHQDTRRIRVGEYEAHITPQPPHVPYTGRIAIRFSDGEGPLFCGKDDERLAVLSELAALIDTAICNEGMDTNSEGPSGAPPGNGSRKQTKELHYHDRDGEFIISAKARDGDREKCTGGNLAAIAAATLERVRSRMEDGMGLMDAFADMSGELALGTPAGKIPSHARDRDDAPGAAVTDARAAAHNGPAIHMHELMRIIAAKLKQEDRERIASEVARALLPGGTEDALHAGNAGDLTVRVASALSSHMQNPAARSYWAGEITEAIQEKLLPAHRSLA